MPSGYEKSPDYGGPEPTPRSLALAIAAIVAVTAFIALLAGWL
jgi:hypothetical protein